MALQWPRAVFVNTSRRHREILEAAIEVFAASGYRQGSLREVAERVGLSQAGVLHHFSSKAELLAAVLALRDEMTIEDLYQGLPQIPGDDLLRNYLRHISHNEQTRGLVELFTVVSAEATSPDHPAHTYFTERYARLHDMLAEAFGDLERDGRLRDGVTPADAAASLIAVTDGIQLQWLLGSPPVQMAELVRQHLGSLTTLVL